MKNKITARTGLLCIPFVAAAIMFSCKSQDESAETTTTDSTTVMKIDSATPVSTDVANNPPDTLKPQRGMAVPNPAKKGKKGKVIVVPSTAKSTAKMEKDASGVYANVEIMPS